MFTNWLIFHDPFTFVVFWVYFTCAIASVNRAPFDLAEAESELVAGFHTEYSGLRWSFFFMAEYGSMFSVSVPGLDPVSWAAGTGRSRSRSILGLTYESRGVFGISRYADWPGQCAGQGVPGGCRHDVGSLDGAAVADRSGDDHLLEILHADRRGHVSGRDAVAGEFLYRRKVSQSEQLEAALRRRVRRGRAGSAASTACERGAAGRRAKADVAAVMASPIENGHGKGAAASGTAFSPALFRRESEQAIKAAGALVMDSPDERGAR